MRTDKWFCDWFSEWVSQWVSESVSQWVSEWVSPWVSKSVSEWVIEWVSQWVSESVSEWVIEWVSEWVDRGYMIRHIVFTNSEIAFFLTLVYVQQQIRRVRGHLKRLTNIINVNIFTVDFSKIFILNNELLFCPF